MDIPKKPCVICGTEAVYQIDHNRDRIFLGCPVCGRYELGAYDASKLNFNHLLSFLAYHRFRFDDFEYRYHSTLSKDECDQYKKEFNQGTGRRGWPVHMDSEIIENWYPKTFSERIDSILLYINTNAPHIGQEISWSFSEALGALFVDRYENGIVDHGEHKVRNEDDVEHEMKYMLDYLQESSYINYTEGPDENESFILSLAPNGYKRVDELKSIPPMVVMSLLP